MHKQTDPGQEVEVASRSGQNTPIKIPNGNVTFPGEKTNSLNSCGSISLDERELSGYTTLAPPRPVARELP